MSDFLLELSANPQMRRVVQSLGLPLPMPTQLARAEGPMVERPLAGASVVVGGGLGGAVGDALARALMAAGADPHVAADALPKTFVGAGEAFGRRAQNAAEVDGPVDALVFDASEIGRPEDLVALHEFFHAWIRRLGRSGRVIVVGRPAVDAASAAEAAAAAALDGFTRSVAKEVGRKGSTAQLLQVESGAEPRLAGPLRFFLSRRSAYVTGQPVHIGRAVSGAAPERFERSLAGKVALVTGAARGIGEATARLLAQEGARVICLDRPEDDAAVTQVAHDIGGEAVLQDITADAAPGAIVAAVAPGLDIIVHNAGVTRDKTLAKMDEAWWRQAVEVNLAAVVRIDAALLGAGAIREGGRVICLSSVAGIAGNVGQTNYAASKAGLVGYVRHLAGEVADRGIGVNAIAPGFIETRLTEVMPFMIREGARRLSALGQGGQPDDVGHAITFLATPGSVGITGSVLRVCGGALVGA